MNDGTDGEELDRLQNFYGGTEENPTVAQSAPTPRAQVQVNATSAPAGGGPSIHGMMDPAYDNPPWRAGAIHFRATAITIRSSDGSAGEQQVPVRERPRPWRDAPPPFQGQSRSPGYGRTTNLGRKRVGGGTTLIRRQQGRARQRDR